MRDLRRSVPTLADPCNCKPCNCEQCTMFAKNYDCKSIEHRLQCENKSHDDLIFNHLTKSIIYDGENPATITLFGDVGHSDNQYSPCSCTNCIQHCLSLPLVNQTPAVKPGIKMLNSPHKCCLSNSCSLRCVSGGDMVGKPTEEYHNFYTSIVENHQVIPQNVDFTDSAVCKCSFCECSSCPYREQAGNQESCKTISLLKKYIEDEWKRKLRSRTQDYNYDYGLHGGCPKSTISKVGVIKSSENCSRCISDPNARARPCHCSIKEMLNNLYEHEIEIDGRDNKLLNEQLYKNNYVSTVANVETNTEYITTDKSTETDNQRCLENKVKNYEYTLKIDITAPDLGNISRYGTKQKIKKISKNKIKEQTQKVMNDIINDISRNSQMEQTNQTSFTDLKNHKVDDFIIGCITPIHNGIGHSIVKVAGVSESELPSKDGSFLFQNETFSPTSPEEISKTVSIIDSEMGSYLDELRVQEPCARRVSHHTVSLKWKLPKAIEGIMGYEILVDGKSIERIGNPRRCMAVISCLPPVQRLLITIRTITKTADQGFLPCTTIGYHPRDNKFICV
ncbi:uncharacterized protein LOC133533643 [Cydia pomonella]|uniref:uncharacterized protein LOC133533643 n=1 Tax=Cydia pomonella TaxID=82600 RepID=UPI002ADE953E|nr:uncharacterized protein LOC133533643 [Cydia pomonella]